MNNPSTPFGWETFYSEFADKLLAYKNNRSELLKLLDKAYKDVGQKFPFMESGEPIEDICPFTVFGAFNKEITNANRVALMQSIGKRLGVQASVPSNFDGIPVLNNLRAWFFGFSVDRKPDDIDNLWNMMEVALFLADAPDDEIYRDFVMRYNTVTEQALVKWKDHFLPSMNTDIMIERGNRTLIIDAKYYGKTMQVSYDKRTIHSHNLYQIFSYVKNKDRDNTGNVRGVLLYAKTDEEISPASSYRLSGNRIDVTTLDLNTEFSIIEDRLRQLVNEFDEPSDAS